MKLKFIKAFQPVPSLKGTGLTTTYAHPMYEITVVRDTMVRVKNNTTGQQAIINWANVCYAEELVESGKEASRGPGRPRKSETELVQDKLHTAD